MTDLNKTIQEFERSRVQLSAIEGQVQSLSIQSEVFGQALSELKETKEKKVYKAVGNILILADVKKVEKELSDQKETVDLRLKTVKKQEETVLDKLNKLKAEIEAVQKVSKGEEKQNEAK